jgi:hypothetical protein
MIDTKTLWFWVYVLGLDSDLTQRDLDSEFNSKHFDIEIKKCLKFLRPKNFLGLKFFSNIFSKFYKQFNNIFLRSFKKNFKHLLISIPKCIELNSELILGFGLGSQQGPGPKI